uniref:Uncharacterized protein n=1 Tax=Biomphalaria glabrata TaxID=6526 RepID=A0A2C9LP16_BIOGL
MKVKKLNKYLFLIASVTSLSDLFILHCPPVQERSTAFISIITTAVNKYLQLDFVKNNQQVMSCSYTICFVNTRMNYTNISYKIEASLDKIIFTMELSTHLNWREKQESAVGEWKAYSVPKKHQTTCDLRAYAIYGEPECLWDDVKVTCFIHKVYPKAICQFNFTNID